MNKHTPVQAPLADLDRVLAHRGGYLQATEKLVAYAVIVIRKRSGPNGNRRAVLGLDPVELVKDAVARLVEMESLDDGEAVYCQLRRHIDNAVHGVAKSKKPQPKSVAIAAGVPVEGSREVGEPEDCTATDVADGVEQAEEDDFNRDLLRQQQSKYKPDSREAALIGHILDGWTERGDIAELMGITAAQFDIVYKRVGRAVRELKDATLTRAV